MRHLTHPLLENRQIDAPILSPTTQPPPQSRLQLTFVLVHPWSTLLPLTLSVTLAGVFLLKMLLACHIWHFRDAHSDALGWLDWRHTRAPFLSVHAVVLRHCTAYTRADSSVLACYQFSILVSDNRRNRPRLVHARVPVLTRPFILKVRWILLHMWILALLTDALWYGHISHCDVISLVRLLGMMVVVSKRL